MTVRAIAPALALVAAVAWAAPSSAHPAHPAQPAHATQPTHPAHTPSRVHTMIPADPSRPVPTTNADESSLNWAGYAVVPAAGQRITSVHSTFVVPTVDTVSAGFAAAWAGIGGFDPSSSDLIQAGVAMQAPTGVFGYYVWYELLPDAETPITGCSADPACTVDAGDTMTVDIAETSPGSNAWTIFMSSSRGWTFTKRVDYPSTHSSAEWILEPPTLVAAQTTLPTMGPTRFRPHNTFSVDGGAARTIASGNPVSIDILTVEATPSPLRADGESFDVCAYALTCP